METVFTPKLRGYLFLIDMQRITIEDIPEPYKKAISEV